SMIIADKRGLYRKFFTLLVLVTCLFMLLPTNAQIGTGNSCFGCDLNNSYCRNHCSSVPPSEYTQCMNSCADSYEGCYNSCNAAYAGYHYYGDISGYSSLERDHCFAMAH